MRRLLVLGAVCGVGLSAQAQRLPEGVLVPPHRPYCSGEYADDLLALSSAAREAERQLAGPYTFAVRNTAVYECLSYAADGTMKRARQHSVAHGTAFAYRRVGNETLLLTNQHVAERPAVSGDEHPVENVRAGCKKVSESLRIVDSESDEYERDDVPLTKLVADVQLDVAVLRASTPLPVLPWKVGRSAALRSRNAVEVRGFPLGALRATNLGKVISPYDRDDYKEYDHVDFVIDAPLSVGNSGSPVLAVSCKTGEYELVGIYHAQYVGGSLYVVVGIDQIRDLITTLRRTARPGAGNEPLDPGQRKGLTEAARAATESFFPFGSATALVRARPDGSLLYQVFDRDFPLEAHPILVIEDLPPIAPGEFGLLGRVWFGAAHGLKAYSHADFDGDVLNQLSRLVDELRRDSALTLAYRAVHDAGGSREAFERASRLRKKLSRPAASRQELQQLATELAERYAPRSSEQAVPLAEALAAAQKPLAAQSANADEVLAEPAREPGGPSALDASRGTGTR